MRNYNWVLDYRGDTRANMYHLKRTIIHEITDFQEILIADTEDFGRALFLDGIPQSSSLDEHIYHESLVHPALLATSHPKNVCIAGGGEGTALREVLKHNTIEKVIVLEIDPMVMNLYREHMIDWHQGSIDDPRVTMLCEDARKYLNKTDERFDCIIIDMPDPLEGSPAAGLFTKEFYSLAKSRLNPNGTIGLQAEAADIADYTSHISIIKTLQECFSCVLPYQSWISFYGLCWGFAVAGDSNVKERLASHLVDQTLANRGCRNLKYYDAETHVHMFSRPKYLREGLYNAGVGTIISDKSPLIVE